MYNDGRLWHRAQAQDQAQTVGYLPVEQCLKVQPTLIVYLLYAYIYEKLRFNKCLVFFQEL